MSELGIHLQAELDRALQLSNGSSSMNINQNFLPVFKKVAKLDAAKIRPAIVIYLKNMRTHRWNAIYSLYALCVIADTSIEAKEEIKKEFKNEEIKYYSEDEDTKIAGNAQILIEILCGKRLSDFLGEKDIKETPVVVHGDQYIFSGNKFGDNNVNVIGSKNISIVAKNLSDLSDEIESKYDKQDKSEVLDLVKQARQLVEKGEDKPAILKILGTVLSKTAEVATIATFVADIISKV